MKFVTFAAAMLFTVSSYATSIMPLMYQFGNVSINGDLTDYVANAYIHGDEIHVNVLNDQSCPPDRFCALHVMPPVASFSAPIVDSETSCGSIYYTAIIDRRPVDGLRVSITLVDHRARTCMDYKKGAVELYADVTGPMGTFPTSYQLTK